MKRKRREKDRRRGEDSLSGAKKESDEERLVPPSKLMKKFEDQLRGGRFRYLNQQLYCSSGESSLSMFQKDKSLFQEYHEGYLESMKQWSIQPVDVAIRWLKKQKSGMQVVDYGCGEAKIMKTPLPHKVTSLDFMALHPAVIPCDMAHSPLQDSSHDIAVFSLALMGTNYGESLLDASRVLKTGGLMWIAEVCSRFVNRQGKEDYHSFYDAMSALGFEKILSKKPCKLFVVLVFKKTREVKRKERIQWPFLKPCVYKRR